MHCALIEFARNVAYSTDADSIEFNPSTNTPIITPIHHPENENEKIAPMRKGAIPIKLTASSLIAYVYGELLIFERFRHNYRVNTSCCSAFSEEGLIMAGYSADGQHCETFELPINIHPWYVGVQFRPEFKSRVTRPSPLYKAFIAAALQGGKK